MERYELVSSALVAGIIPVTKYKSKETGLTVFLANVDGPVVNGYFCLATEAHDDDGLPHTLEHLIFLGSEDYPYKGMLDQFANRCLATGTNAWTDIDHTAYTINTAGSEGFLNIMSIYLDHIIYPTITETGYVTEVHHVNGDGEDAGIVYCEMQARENLESSLVHYQFLQCMYPGYCGYKSETGGIMKNLRTSCSYEKVCKYHTAFYRPDNLCLVIAGVVQAKDVFERLTPFEEKIKSKPPLGPLIRPWTGPVPPLDDNLLEAHVLFSTEDESTGSVMMGWRGPDVNERYQCDALRMLFKYLTETSVAPLQQELVEIEEPFCGDVYCNFFQNSETAICIIAEAVLKEHLLVIKDKVLDVLKCIASGKDTLDMERLGNVIHKSILENMNELEESPHDALAFIAIGDFLYSKDGQLQDHVDKIKRLKKLKTEDESFWLSHLKKYVMESKMVVVVGEPSEEKMNVAGEEEKKRIEMQVADLGKDGLKDKDDIVKNAVEKNGVEAPPELVNKLPIPSVDTVKFHDIKSLSNRGIDDNIKEFQCFTMDGITCAFQILHCKSLFTEIYVVVDTSALTDQLRLYLPLFAEIFFESPLVIDGVIKPYEDVVTQLEADTVEYNANVGEGGGRFSPSSFSALFTIQLKIENEKYERGVQWIKDVMYNLKFTAERLKISSNKIINAVANSKRSGQAVLKAVHENIDFVKGSNFFACNMVRQHAFLIKCLEEVDSAPEKVLHDMEMLRESLFKKNPENLRFYISANLNNLPENADKVWKELLFKDIPNVVQKVKDIPRDSSLLSNKKEARAVGIGSVESAFMTQRCAGVESYTHQDYPAILVFIEYLCALEGPLWRLIRGCGLSYNCTIKASPGTGKLQFCLAKSTHIFKAYMTAKGILQGYIDGTTPFEYGQLEAARSGTLYEIISGEETISRALFQHIYAEFKEVKPSFRRTLLRAISNVSVEDLQRVGKKYFINLFDPCETSIALCCHPTKLDEIVQSFSEVGINFKVVLSLEEEFQI